MCQRQNAGKKENGQHDGEDRRVKILREQQHRETAGESGQQGGPSADGGERQQNDRGKQEHGQLLRPVTGSGVDHVLGRQEEHHERHGLDKAEFEPPENQVQRHSADFDHEKERECSSLERMKEGPGQDVERRVPIKPCE